jgi:N-acetylglucosaminyldiphosphoundecaprenol N-acetyl-beta-D-mannosaminyltransferase
VLSALTAEPGLFSFQISVDLATLAARRALGIALPKIPESHLMVDFHRNVHCLMGLPIDAISLPEAARALDQARQSGTRCFFSTPNLNFVIASQSNVRFRDSVSLSDLSLADGMPLVWVAKLLGVPVKGRVSGANLFEFLRKQSSSLWNVFFFGGPKGTGQEACLAIGGKEAAMHPSGYIYPGFVGVEEMSRPDLIDCINASNSDMLVVSLGAAKGQEWICQNLDKLHTPVVAHLGAVINFVAGKVQRAPVWMQRTGLEWLWRIKEERSLLGRYAQDGLAFLGLLVTQVIPLAIFQRWRAPSEVHYERASIRHLQGSHGKATALGGAWRMANLAPLRTEFSRLERLHGDIYLDLAEVSGIDSAFIGLLLLLEMALHQQGRSLRLARVSRSLVRQFRLSGASHLVQR